MMTTFLLYCITAWFFFFGGGVREGVVQNMKCSQKIKIDGTRPGCLSAKERVLFMKFRAKSCERQSFCVCVPED